MKQFLDFCEYEKYKENPNNIKDFIDNLKKKKESEKNDYLKDVGNFEIKLDKFEDKEKSYIIIIITLYL